MKILITGANGQLGTELRRCIAAEKNGAGAPARKAAARHRACHGRGHAGHHKPPRGGCLCAPSRAGRHHFLRGVHQCGRLRNKPGGGLCGECLGCAQPGHGRGGDWRKAGACLHGLCVQRRRGAARLGIRPARAALGLRQNKAAGRAVCTAVLHALFHCAYGVAVRLRGQQLCQDDASSGQAERAA